MLKHIEDRTCLQPNRCPDRCVRFPNMSNRQTEARCYPREIDDGR